MEDKRGFSLVEGLMVMLILCIVLGSLFPLMLLKKKIDGRDTASINCIRTEGGNLTSQSCINAVNNCKYERNNGCNNLKYFADLGNDSEKAAALAILKKTCDEGGEKACKYFVFKCKDDNKCDIASDNDLNYYLQLPLNENNPGKMKLIDTLTDFYNNNITNIVTAVNDSCCATGTINFACIISGTTTCDAPNAPTGLSATAGVDVISLLWTDNSSDEEGFKVYQSIDGTTYGIAATVEANIVTATLNNLDPGTYYFKVISYLAARNSNPSNIVTVTIGPLNAPSGLTNTLNGTDATLNWTDNSTNETGFKIYESTNGGANYTELDTVGANTTTYTATGLAGGDHLFKVVAINDGTNSADSNTTTVSLTSSTSWQKIFGGSYGDGGYSLAKDGSGNIFITGACISGSFISDIPVIKLDANGNKLWDRQINSSSNFKESASEITVDATGNVFITGNIGNNGIALIKMDTNGNRLWDRKINSTNAQGESGSGIAVDATGNIFITGGSSNGTDTDLAVIKLDANGNRLWDKRIDSTIHYADSGSGVAIDGTGNIFIIGTSNNGIDNDILLVKMDTNGTKLWDKRINASNGSADSGSKIKIDASGNLFVVADSYYSTSTDIAVIKLDANGNILWDKRLGSTNYGTDYGQDISIDASGNIFIVGDSFNTSNDIAVIKLDANGNKLWDKRLDSTYYDYGSGIEVDGSGNIFIGGSSSDMLVMKMSVNQTDDNVFSVATNVFTNITSNIFTTKNTESNIFTNITINIFTDIDNDTFTSADPGFTGFD